MHSPCTGIVWGGNFNPYPRTRKWLRISVGDGDRDGDFPTSSRKILSVSARQDTRWVPDTGNLTPKDLEEEKVRVLNND